MTTTFHVGCANKDETLGEEEEAGNFVLLPCITETVEMGELPGHSRECKEGTSLF